MPNFALPGNRGSIIPSGASSEGISYGGAQGKPSAPTQTTLSQDQARAANQGKPGYDVFGNPVQTGIVSSAQPSMNTQLGSANGAAAAALAPTPATGSGYDWYAQQVLAQQRSGIDTAQSTFNTAMANNKLQYDAALAKNNLQYQTAFEALSRNHQNAVGAAQNLAASLNPYGSSTQSSATKAYMQKLDGIYQQQEATLKAQADVAQQALEAGNQEAFSKAQQAMQSAIQSANTQAFTAIRDLQKDALQSTQFQLTYGLQNAQLTESTKKSAADDFRMGLTALNYSPEFVDQMVKSGQIYQDPTYRAGIAAYGTDASEGIINAMKQGSLAYQKELNLQAYRDQQTFLAQERIAAATDRQTKVQLALASNQAIRDAQMMLASSGVAPDSLDYALGMSNASGGNPNYLNASQEAKYVQLGTLVNQLSSMKGSIESVDKKSPLMNILISHAGKDISSLTDADRAVLNTELKALSGVIGKTIFGESGNLSNSDINRVLDRLPTSGSTNQVRDALYKGLVEIVSTNVKNQLIVDSSYHNTANYAPLVKTFVDKADSITLGSTDAGKAGKTTSGNTFKLLNVSK